MTPRLKKIKKLEKILLIFYDLYHRKILPSISADSEFVDGGKNDKLFISEKFTSNVLFVENSIIVLTTVINSNLNNFIIKESDINELIFDLKNLKNKFEFEESLNYYFDSNSGIFILNYKRVRRNKNYSELSDTEIKVFDTLEKQISKIK